MAVIPRTQPATAPASEHPETTRAADLSAWRSYCRDLIHGAAQGPIPYARAFMARQKCGRDPVVRAWLASQPDEQAVNDLMAGWRDWGGGKRVLGHALLAGEELHHWLLRTFPAARTGLERARLATGEEVPNAAEAFQALNRALAEAAGDKHNPALVDFGSMPPSEARLEATIITSITLFPPKPGHGPREDRPAHVRQEVTRREGRTDEARQRDAEAIARDITGEDAGFTSRADLA